MHKAIDADYYGFRDEDDGVLLRVEAAAERRIKRQVGYLPLSTDPLLEGLCFFFWG
jgi:hypothetical protein